jgi:hypothetical protein
MYPYKPGYILTLRVTETGKGNRMKAEVVNDEFQKCTVTMQRITLDPSVISRLARHLRAKSRVRPSRTVAGDGVPLKKKLP